MKLNRYVRLDSDSTSVLEVARCACIVTFRLDQSGSAVRERRLRLEGKDVVEFLLVVVPGLAFAMYACRTYWTASGKRVVRAYVWAENCLFIISGLMLILLVYSIVWGK